MIKSIIDHVTRDLTVKSTLITVAVTFGGGSIALSIILLVHLIAGSLGLIPPIFHQTFIVGVM